MKIWNKYKVQMLLLMLAILQGFAYFYPGYVKGITLPLLQGLLIIIVICLLYNNRKRFIHRKLY